MAIIDNMTLIVEKNKEPNGSLFFLIQILLLLQLTLSVYFIQN